MSGAAGWRLKPRLKGLRCALLRYGHKTRLRGLLLNSPNATSGGSWFPLFLWERGSGGEVGGFSQPALL